MISRRQLIAASVASLAAPSAAQAALRPRLDLRQLVEEMRVPALGVAVINTEGVKTIEVFGRRRFDRPEPVKATDVWHIGDNTMAITSALYARLVEAGKSSWGAKISAVLPGVTLDPAYKDLTVEALLAHRTGLSDSVLLSPDWIAKGHADTRPLPEQRMDAAKAWLGAAPTGKPGEFLVARANYVIAGAVIEALAGQSYEDFAKAEAFDWWGAVEAGFGAPLSNSPLGHARPERGQLTPVEPGDLADYPRLMNPATGVHLTLSEYGRFVQLILTNGGGWLKPISLAHLARPYDKADEGYGLGWKFTDQAAWAKGPLLSHEGSNTMWRAHIVVAPGRDLGMIAVCNADNELACQRALQVAVKAFGEDAPVFNELKL
jgi:CubicO group peptidase (beta-lactamase class C family)